MKKLCFIGVLIVSGLGTLFHFLYKYIPLFIFPINESIFEHVKLIIFPFFLYMLGAVIFYNGDRSELVASFFTAILAASFFIVSAYYTYSGFLGNNIDAVNIIIYYLGVILGFLIIYKKKTLFSFANSVIFMIILFILVGVLTYYPPNLAFFRVQ